MVSMPLQMVTPPRIAVTPTPAKNTTGGSPDLGCSWPPGSASAWGIPGSVMGTGAPASVTAAVFSAGAVNDSLDPLPATADTSAFLCRLFAQVAATT